MSFPAVEGEYDRPLDPVPALVVRTHPIDTPDDLIELLPADEPPYAWVRHEKRPNHGEFQ